MIIETQMLPKGINGICLFPFIFVRDKSNKILVNHELIHYEQQKELVILPFYIWYLYEQFTNGYKENRFEVEAKKNQYNLEYLNNRMRYAF